MDRQVLGTRLVQDALKQFIPVRVNAWEELDIVEKYQVPSTPTFAVLDSSGKLVLRTDGFVPVEDFVAFLEVGGAAVNAPS